MENKQARVSPAGGRRGRGGRSTVLLWRLPPGPGQHAGGHPEPGSLREAAETRALPPPSTADQKDKAVPSCANGFRSGPCGRGVTSQHTLAAHEVGSPREGAAMGSERRRGRSGGPPLRLGAAPGSRGPVHVLLMSSWGAAGLPGAMRAPAVAAGVRCGCTRSPSGPTRALGSRTHRGTQASTSSAASPAAVGPLPSRFVPPIKPRRLIYLGGATGRRAIALASVGLRAQGRPPPRASVPAKSVSRF